MWPVAVGAGKIPFGLRICLPHVELRGDPLRHRNRAHCVFRLAESDVERTIAEFVPAQPEAFFGAKSAIEQDRRHVP